MFRIVMLVVLTLAGQCAKASPSSDAMMQRRAAAMDEQSDMSTAILPTGIRVVRDVAYGSDINQRFDVYAPAHAQDAPVILMVHGGGWRIGDKAARGVIENKVARWVPRGFIVISTNYRLLPSAAPLQQAKDVAAALVAAQNQVSSWGGDRHKFILMGHSSGAHLVALIAAEPSIAIRRGATPWLGTIALDSAALDVVQIMQSPHFPLYDKAFGSDATAWTAASPFQQLSTAGAPFLSVCSSLRKDSCPQAHQFVDKAVSLGTRAQVLEEPLTHMEINQQLGTGTASDYTTQVEAFMRGLDPAVARLLDDGYRQVAALPVVISR